VLCPSCRSSNPNTNRFCGSCGAALVPVPSELPKELIEYDKKIPLIAEPGSDRRSNVPEKIREQVREIVERDRRLEADRRKEAEAQRVEHASTDEYRAVQLPANFMGMDTTELNKQEAPVRAAEPVKETRTEIAPRVESTKKSAPSNGFLHLDYDPKPVAEAKVEAPPRIEPEYSRPVESVKKGGSSNGFLHLDYDPRPVVETRIETPKRVVDTPSSMETVQKPAANGFLNLDYNPRKVSETSLSGPSFLGLNESAETEYVDEEVEESHARRNVAALLLLVMIGLGATQWREIKNTALPFVKNGTEFIKVRKKGEKPVPAPDVNANGATATNAPNIEVAPTNQELKKQELAAAAVNPPADGSQGANPTTGAGNPGTTNAASTNNAGGVAGAAAVTAATPSATENSAVGDGKTSVANNTSVKDQAAKDTAAKNAAADSSDEAATDDAEAPTKEIAKNAKLDAVGRRGRKPSGADRPQIADDSTQVGQAELAQASATSNPTLQASWLWKAVKKGNSDASVRLAEMYIIGRGVDKNCDQAMMLLRSASAHSNARARGKLGAMYATGECVPQDRVQAYHWMTMALNANPASSWTAQYRDSLWTQMTAGEKMRAERER
jgi:hypothetical protein